MALHHESSMWEDIQSKSQVRRRFINKLIAALVIGILIMAGLVGNALYSYHQRTQQMIERAQQEIFLEDIFIPAGPQCDPRDQVY